MKPNYGELVEGVAVMDGQGLSRTLRDSQYVDYFEELFKQKGFVGKAAKKIGVHPIVIYRRIEKDPGFKEAVDVVRKFFKNELVEELEWISFEQARKPSGTRERIFQLQKQKPEVYGDKREMQLPDIHISFGFDLPKIKGVKDAEFKDI